MATFRVIGTHYGAQNQYREGDLIVLPDTEGEAFPDKLERVGDSLPPFGWGNLDTQIVKRLTDAGFTPASATLATDEELLAIPRIGEGTLKAIREELISWK